MNRYLLVRFAAMGDCVMAAWAATSIRNRHPDAFLCWAVQTRCIPVIDTNSLADVVWEVRREAWKRSRWSVLTWKEQLLSYTGLRKLRFDVGIDFHGHAKTALCLRLSGARQRIAARAADALAQRLNPVVGKPPSDMHMVEWNQRVLEQLGDFQLAPMPIMPYSQDATELAKRELGRYDRLATINVGASHPAKRYPSEMWRKVGQELRDQHFDVAFLGGPEDLGIEEPGTRDLVGRLPLEVTLAAIRLSKIHLAADTGTGHIAAAFGVPVVSVFGPTNPVGFRPYTNHGIVLQRGTSPDSVTPDEIVGAALRLLCVNNAPILN